MGETGGGEGEWADLSRWIYPLHGSGANTLRVLRTVYALVSFHEPTLKTYIDTGRERETAERIDSIGTKNFSKRFRGTKIEELEAQNFREILNCYHFL